jgi:hypothetical protein
MNGQKRLNNFTLNSKNMIGKDTSNSRPNRDPISAGMHIARAYGLFDLGTHYDEKFAKERREIVVVWEIPGERIDVERNGKKTNLPRAISKRYTLSLHEKARLRADLESWRGRPFTAEELTGFVVKTILGKPCLLNITHSKKEDRIFANIGAITPLMKGMTAPAQENPDAFFSFDDGSHHFPKGMPDWICEAASASKEWIKLSTNPKEVAAEIKTETEAVDVETSLPF